MLAVIVRHAEALINTGADRDPDSGLTELGRRQVDRLAQRLSKLPVSAVYSSPYRRALLTAQPVAAAMNLPVTLRPELCEYHGVVNPDLAGFAIPSWEVLCDRYPFVRLDPEDDGGWVHLPPLQESLDGLVARQRRLIGRLKERWTREEDVILLFGHGAPIARFVEAWVIDAPGPAFRFMPDNAAVNCLRHVAGISTLMCLNEVSHLQGLPPSRGSNFTVDGGFRAQPPAAYW